MVRELTNHLWQSTVFAMLAALAALALRKNRASVRYWMWFAASAKFLVPFALLISLGSLVEPKPTPRQRQSVAPPSISYSIVGIAPPALPRVPSRPRVIDWASIAFGVWACGTLVLLLMRVEGWRRIRAVVTLSTPVAWRGAMEIRETPGRLEPGVVGIFRPVLLLPVGIAQSLSPRQLDAVLAHEMSHVRRRDNLFAAFHMVVEAIFWFHPMIWWIGAKLVEERELACDEEVVSSVGDPAEYAEGILNVCKMYVESPLPCVSGVTGADIKRRIHAILSGDVSEGLTRVRKIGLACAAVAVVAAPIVIGITNAPWIRAQSAAASRPQFEVASVRPHAGGADRDTLVPPTSLPGGRFVSRFPLGILIAYAYNLPFNTANGRWTGVPHGAEWAQGRQGIYDIEATSVMPPGLSVQARDERVREMVQALLEDRFKLVMRRESREMPVYALVVAKGGLKLQRADIEEKDCPEGTAAALGPQTAATPSPNGCHDISGGTNRGIHARAANMSDLANFVENWMDRPLVDKTGITGLYRIEAEPYQRLDVMPDASAAADVPTVFEMFEKLGLRLEKRKGVVEVYVIDHIEKPSEN